MLKNKHRKNLGINLPSKLIKISAVCWVLSIVCFGTSLAIATKGFTATVRDTQFGSSTLYLSLLLGSMGIGSLAFGILILAVIIKVILEKKVLEFRRSFKGIVVFGIKFSLLLTVLPLFLLYKVSGLGDLLKRFRKEGFNAPLRLKGIRLFLVRLVAIVAISLTLLPIWVGGYWIVGELTAQQLGYLTQPIPIAGTGSMYPTFPKGKTKTPKEQGKELVSTPGMFPYPNGLVLFSKRIFGYQINRGDIVVIANEKIRELGQKTYGEPSGWVKRIIGVAGDSIELREGIVYLNSQPLKESYIAKAHSTFGETFLKECNKVTIPENYIFVMGDNRKGSGDSREIGFIDIGAVKYVLPLEKQKGILDKQWRDTSKDFDESSKIKLGKEKYLDLLNEERKKVGVKPLKYQPKLEKAAFKRGEVILKYDDFSYEATRSGYTQLKAMNDAGYSNITYGEIPILGYYEGDELIENQFEFPKTKEFLLNKDFQEIGIAEVEGSLNGCPAQVMVQHFAGYVPPNYSKADIDSWKNILSRLKEIQPSWNKLKEYQNVYGKSKTEVDRINQIISIRISNIEAIVGRMDSNQWLTGQERDYINQDKKLFDEQEALATKLNNL